MDRVKSKKPMQVTHVAVVPEDQADSPETRIVERVRPTKAVPDPAQRPQFSMDGYGPPELAFRIGLKTKSGSAGDSVPIHFREKQHDKDSKVRVYYAGAVLLGSVSFAPSSIVAHFQHNLGAEQFTKCDSVEALHDHLRKLLQQAAP